MTPSVSNHMNLNEQTNRIKQMMGILSEQKIDSGKPVTNTPNVMGLQQDAQMRKACEAKVSKTTLDKAKKWWKDWINNPTTKQRVKAKSNLSDEQINNVFKNYITIIDKIVNLKYHMVDTEENAVMYIRTEDNTTVNVNCNQATDKEITDVQIVGILVHEIQHLLDEYYELIPDDALEKDFSLSLKGYDPRNKTGLILDMNRVNQSFEALKKEGFDEKALEFYKKELIDVYENGDPEYIQLTTELRSFIYGVRNELGKTSGQNITLDEIKKLANGKNRGNIYWLMVYVLNSGKSMTEVLNNVNSYAVTNTNNQPKTA